MKEVHVLIIEYPYEGIQILGVYASKEEALEEARVRTIKERERHPLLENNYEVETWQVKE